MATTLQTTSRSTTSAITDLDLLVQLRPFPTVTTPDFEAAWRDLERRSLLRNPFLSPSFLLPQWEVNGSPPAELLTIQDQKGRWLFAGCFERVRGSRTFPIPHLNALRTQHTFKTGVLVDATDCEVVIDTLWQFLRSMNLHGLCFPTFPTQSSLSRLMTERCEQGLTRSMFLGVHQRAVTSLAEMDDPGMSSKRAKSIRRGRRALERQGLLEFRIRDQAGVEDFLRLERMGWKGDIGSALACDEQQALAFRRVIANFGRQMRVHFAELTLDQRVVASMCLFRSESDYYAFKIGWDPQFERGCPGFLLAAEIQSHLSDLPGCERLDSCSLPGSFLEHVWADRKSIGTAIFTTTRWGSLAISGSQLVRELLHRVRGTSSPNLQENPADVDLDAAAEEATS